MKKQYIAPQLERIVFESEEKTMKDFFRSEKDQYEINKPLPGDPSSPAQSWVTDLPRGYLDGE